MKKTILLGMLLSGIAFSGISQSWYQVPVPTAARLNAIDFASDNVGYIVGDSATILKTTDGGVNWTKLNATFNGISFGNAEISDVQFISETTGYLILNGGTYGTAKTTDGGLTWATVPNNTTNQCFPVSVYAFAEDDLMIGGSDCFQGATITQYQAPDWTVKTVNYETFDTNHEVVEFDFEGSLGLAAVRNEYILRSTDYGQTWDSIHVALASGSVLTSVIIASNDTIYAGYDANGGGFGILMSVDNGLTWAQDGNSATFYYPVYYDLCEANNGYLYAGARPSNLPGGLILTKSDQMFWWADPVDEPIYAMDSYGSNVTFGVGANGYVVINQPLATIGMDEISMGELQLSLTPNPSGDNVTVFCSEGLLDWIEIKDMQGATVKRVFAGATTVNIDLSTLAGGMYFVQSLVNGQQQVSKLLKY